MGCHKSSAGRGEGALRGARLVLGTGQGALCRRCACTAVRASACTLSSQAGSSCTSSFPITLLRCLGESHAWFDVPLSASPYQKGGGGWGHPVVASPPAPAHVVLVLELVPAPTSSPALVSVCHRLLGSRGRLLPASCRGDGAGAVPGAVAPGWQPHPGQVQCPRGLLQAPLLECPAQPETGMRKFLGSISVSLPVSGLGGKVQGTRWNCVCTFEACDRSLFWRISMKRHEKPILLLIWLKQVGDQDGDARSSWQRWLRVVLPPLLCGC